MLKPKYLLALLSFLTTAVVGAQEAEADKKLSAGDPAPPIKSSEWIQGEAITEFKKGHVYLVEFWAEWCGPCKAMIPHVQELHEKFKDQGFTVIGQNVWENDIAAAKEYVKEQSEAGQLSFPVALDDTEASEKGFMADNWMAAAGRRGIPSTFLVDGQGKIAWIGHPSGVSEDMVGQLIKGEFDAEKAAKAQREAEAKQAARGQKIQAISKMIGRGEYDEALKALQEAEEGVLSDDATMTTMLKVRIAVGKKDVELARTAVQAAGEKDDEAVQSSRFHASIAQVIATSDEPSTAFGELALKHAEKAIELNDNEAFSVMLKGVRAESLAAAGKFSEAVTAMEKVIADLDGDENGQNFFQSRLEAIKQRQKNAAAEEE